MKFKIEETVWGFDITRPKFMIYDECGNFVTSESSLEKVAEACRNYKLAKEVKPKITYIEV